MKKTYPIVQLDGCKLSENVATIGTSVYHIAHLLEKVKEADLKVFELPLAGIDLDNEILVSKTVKELAEHIKRCLEVDTSYPIILNENGTILDGWHRIVKALVDGKETIKAVRFQEEPRASYIKTE